jgi:hypothetical protein
MTISRGTRYTYTKFNDLIRFSRNLLEHYNEILKNNPKIVPIVGNTQKDIVRYLVKCFPWLMVVIYIINRGFPGGVDNL